MKISDILKKKIVEVRGVRVVVSPNMPWQDYIEGTKIEDAEQRGVYIVSKSIESWDIEDDNGQPLPINTESVKILPVWLMQPIMEAMQELQEEKEKKKTNS